ncbi:hypothetical protein [Actinoplanes sp. NPDC051859]|uniref:hypothetical protein n=1 Tax=Actinoplanes sp. NPDC051859 TaxID=3363909 RepID=UPI0037A135EA
MLSAADASLLDEIVEIALTPGTPEERAAALLEPLRRLTPSDALFITAFDPDSRMQTPLLRHGYTEAVSEALDGPQFTADIEQAGLQGPRPPVRLVDLQFPVDRLPTWSEYLYPAGIREGLGAGLFTRDGRYLGVVNTSSADARPATDEARALLHHAGPWIAHAIDPLRTVNAIAALVSDAVAGVALTRSGNTQPLTGLPGHDLLAPGTPLLATAAAHPAGSALAAFLCPADPHGGLFRVSILACPPHPPGHLTRVLLLSPAPYPHGLTRTELQILGHLVDDSPPTRLAPTAALPAHLASITTKLNAVSHRAAAVLAHRRGAYIPPQLTPAAR